ncbi:MAG: hypothetical protein IPG67_06100 [Acidobacteria bacterium]|nr:hypothetical protein [Acidobacteriota bacterium]
MGTNETLCLSAAVLVIAIVIYLTISGIKKSKKDKRFVDEMMGRNGWQHVENPKEDLREWVLAELNAQPDLYPLFGQVSEWGLLSSVHRDRMLIGDLWTKQDGERMYFVLDATDWYIKPGGKRNSRSYHRFTIVGLRAPASLPFLTLLPKMEFPKTTGWRYSISEAHNLNLSDKVNQTAFDLAGPYMDRRVRQPLEMPKILAVEEEKKPSEIDPPIATGSPAFDERFELYGKETERIRQFFDNEKLAELASLPQTFVDAGRELIFVYIP